MLENKRVLFCPVFSVRSYKTGEYNLAIDGNMARIISKIVGSKLTSATVLIPEKTINLDVWQKILKRHQVEVTFIPCSEYGENARATRDNCEGFKNWLSTNINPNDFDIFVVEPNYLALHSDELNWNNLEIIYWCVASATSLGTPWFVEDFAETDKAIAQKFKTACASYSQVEYLQGKSYLDKDFYRPEIFDYKTIFFPFRLSDKNYQAEFVRDTINKLREMGYNNFKVLYTDVNDSEIFKEDEVFVKVPSQKEVYLSILKSRPIIPYMENADVLMHINITEFMHYKCNVILKKNHTILSDDFYYIDSEEDLLKALQVKLEEGN